MKDMIRSSLEQSKHAIEKLLEDERVLEGIFVAGKTMSEALLKGNRIFSCGNGGSMCDSMHFAEELTGRFRRDRPPLAAISISDPAHLSCVSNDFGYDDVFSRYILAHGRPGDVLLAISTSGKSPNILKAAQVAQSLPMSVVALTGRSPSPLDTLANTVICTKGGTEWSDRIQELHIKVIHCLVEIIEKIVFSRTSE